MFFFTATKFTIEKSGYWKQLVEQKKKNYGKRRRFLCEASGSYWKQELLEIFLTSLGVSIVFQEL